jgi:Mrp family chromosome partitioning ATPase
MFEEAPSRMQNDSFRAFWKALRRHWWLVALCLILVPAAAYGYSRTRTKQYTATASILVRDPSLTAQLATSSSSSAPSSQGTSVLADVTNLASEDVVAQQTARALGPGYAGKGLPGTVTPGNAGGSDILTISAVESSPALAAHVANTYARQFIKFQTSADVANIRTEIADLEAQLGSGAPGGTAGSSTGAPVAPAPAGAAGAPTRSFLQQRLTQLETQAALQNANLQVVVQAAAPKSPSSPGTPKIVAIGVGLGFVLGMLLVVLFAVVDRRLRDPGEVEAILDIPVLGVIQQSRALGRRWGRKPKRLKPIDIESFAMVYANMRHYTRGAIRSVLVTSPRGGEGKSTVAWNLAATAARAGAKVLLIESDMRRPSIGPRLGLEPGPGLVDVLNDQASLADAAVPLDLSDYELNRIRELNGDGDGSLDSPELVIDADVVVEGPAHNGLGNGNGDVAVIPSPARLSVLFAGDARSASGAVARSPLNLLSSSRMANLIRAAEKEYDLVVIDSPPASVVCDAIPLIKHVSGVLVITRAGRSTREEAQHLREQLHHLRARIVGAVVNGADSLDDHYQYSSTYLRHGV